MANRLLCSSGDSSEFFKMVKNHNNGKPQVTKTAFDNLKAAEKKLLQELEAVKAEAKEKVKKLEEECHDLKEKIEVQKKDFEAEKNDLEKQTDELQSVYNKISGGLVKVDNKFKKFKNVKYQNSKTNISELEQKVKDLQESLTNAKDMQRDLKRELETMTKRADGFLQAKKYVEVKNRALLRELNETKDSFIGATLKKDGIPVPTRQHVDYRNPNNDDYYARKTSYRKSYRSSPYGRR